MRPPPPRPTTIPSNGDPINVVRPPAPYRTAPKTPEERADDAEMELARAQRRHRAALSVIIAMALSFSGSMWLAIAGQMQALEERAEIAVRAMHLREQLSAQFAQSHLDTLLGRITAEEQRDICASGWMLMKGIKGPDPVTFRFYDRLTGDAGEVSYRWDVPTGTWRRP